MKNDVNNDEKKGRGGGLGLTVIAAALAWGLIGATCADEDCDYPPDSCRRTLPPTASLLIKVSEPLPAEVRVYSGSSFETGTLVWSGVPAGTAWTLSLPHGKNYSATALYVSGGDSVLAVDGDRLDYSTDDYCGTTCYSLEDGEVDLRRL